LDKQQRLCPVGVAGELYIGGDGLARGYLNRPDLTATAFIDHPFSNISGARLYRTGDKAKWLPDGNIIYLGRIDDQMKWNGHRIEPGEIETVLQRAPGVKQAVVMLPEDERGNKRLVAYIVTQSTFNRQLLLAHARSHLPEYMIPQVFAEVEEIPVTTIGKIDRKKLAAIELGAATIESFVAPGNELEETLVKIWQHILGLERVGIYDNFFELGGNSLLLMRLVAHIKRKLSLVIPIHAIFQFTCVHDLATYIDLQLAKAPLADETNYDIIHI
jgi:non-ribosomal peptide synthetase component F